MWKRNLNPGTFFHINVEFFNGTKNEQGGFDMKSRMGKLTSLNVDLYLENIGQGDWERIDFARFSKKKNPGLKTYHFTIEAVLEQFRTK